jgi:hypothetical protein
MKTLLLIAVLFGFADAGDCWQIKNKDKRHYCESVTEGKRNCWMIKDNDKKHYCESVAYGKNNCWMIKERDLRTMCKSEIGR